VILDLSPEVAMKVATILAGTEVEASDQVVRETVAKWRTWSSANSVTLLNDQGFHFKVFPPEIHVDETGLAGQRGHRAL